MSTPTITQLKQALSIAQQIESLNAQLAALTGGISSVAPMAAAAPARAGKPGRRKLSPQALANIRAAQKARWAKVKGTAPAPAKVPAAAAKKSGAMSAAHRAKLGAAARKRWAAIRAGKATNPFTSKAVKSAPAAKPAGKPKAKRKLSADARAKMAEAAKRRWANVKK